uniref:poly(ADP-ribose) glycohydrolase n=1 Tax=Culex tarsalis TaxID=7177 RepID=A0A1Q3FIR3_CULTA
MALVMLPCDLPWWSNVQKKLTQIEETPTLDVLLEVMQKLHELCNVSLDPDDDGKDQGVFDGLRHFVEQQLGAEERAHFLGHTVRCIARHARNLKLYRPPRGLNFSLQQQGDCYELSYRLVAALLANAFFSTFPKRTEKTHPTLQDFNFTYFFKGLVESNVQKAKFRSFLNYFDWLEANPAELDGMLKVSRKVMTGKQWLTIEDWLECGLPLCDVDIKHEGRLDKASSDTMQTVFASARLGGDVLGPGSSQETLQFFTFPELLAVLLYVEALEDNESLQIENAHHVARIVEPRGRALFEKIEQPKKTSLCCIDAENYRAIPSQQFEEDDILRELNKCLLAFRQNTTCPVVEPRAAEKQRPNRLDQLENTSSKGRLSPIGERDREGSTPGSPDVCTTIFIRQPTPNSKRSSSDSNKLEKDINKRRSWLSPERPAPMTNSSVGSTGGGGLLTAGPRGRFIILGSSGECLPVNRHPLKIPARRDSYSSCESSNDEFHSARDSFDEDDEDGLRARTYMTQLDTPERRFTFAQQLREALKDNNMASAASTEDSSYAVGISITGSQTRDQNIRVKRGGSCGFVLDGSTGSTSEEREWFDRCRQRQNGMLERKETNESSRYSFESDLGSELEEVYEKFAKWLEEPISSDKPKKLDARDEAVLRFANSLLKRTLSESFVGIPFTEDGLAGEKSTEGNTIRTNGSQNDKISQIAQKRTFNVNLRPVATGNWGCGDTKRGDVQLKMVIQWMAASVAGLPYLIYYTAGSEKLSKLDTICRVLKDRKWTVGELAAATLSHAKDILEDPLYYNNDRSYSSFFDKLIGLERTGQ